MKIKVIKQKKTNDTIRFSDLEIGKLYNYTLPASTSGCRQRGIVFVSCAYGSDGQFLVTELMGEDEGYTWDENEFVEAAKFTLLTDTLQLTND